MSARIFTLQFILVLCGAAAGSAFGAVAADRSVTVTSFPDRVRIEIGGRLFSEYFFSGANKPYFYPVLAPDGTDLTRRYPMSDPPGEEHDHPSHRSIWFGHSPVNGEDFWGEPPRQPNAGKVVQESLVQIKSGMVGLIRTRDLWESHAGAPVCTDERVIRAWAVDGGRMLDFTITINASHGPVTFGDNKEGTMAVRVAEWMVMPHELHQERYAGVGHAVNSEGQRDGAGWGKQAAWVDYYGAHNGKILGIALFNRPENPPHLPWWHVREYGLLAANPFGRHDFEGTKDAHAGDFTIPAGGSAVFRYRLYFHEGDTTAAAVAAHYRDFAVEP